MSIIIISLMSIIIVTLLSIIIIISVMAVARYSHSINKP
jgi:hypothetical protein